MPNFVIVDRLREQLTEADRWPSHDALRTFMKDSLKLSTGFRAQTYSEIRRGSPIDGRRKLEYVLMWLLRKDPDFSKDFLGEDWGHFEEEVLFSRYTEAVAEDYEPPIKQQDLIGGGPGKAATALLQMPFSDETPNRLCTEDIPEAAVLLMRAVYRDVVGAFASEVADAERVFLDVFKLKSREDAERMLLAFIRYSPSSVYYYKAGECAGCLSIVLPLSEESCDLLRSGEIDDVELALRGNAPSRSSIIFLAGCHQDWHGLSGAQSTALQIRLMSNTLRQLAELGESILRHGMHIVTFGGCDKIDKWLSRWCFKKVRNHSMKRADFPIWEQRLERTPSFNPWASIIWCLIVIYQAVFQIRSKRQLEPFVGEEWASSAKR